MGSISIRSHGLGDVLTVAVGLGRSSFVLWCSVRGFELKAVSSTDTRAKYVRCNLFNYSRLFQLRSVFWCQYFRLNLKHPIAEIVLDVEKTGKVTQEIHGTFWTDNERKAILMMEIMVKVCHKREADYEPGTLAETLTRGVFCGSRWWNVFHVIVLFSLFLFFKPGAFEMSVFLPLMCQRCS